ncbi:hypothetical protein BDF20DRAFT_863346 [Mycotypha africana]|uniref:uncharacterized protein n=1 Tax=Mycotypha africana TaxID=64632 RepID=UPI002300E2D2|nr:uncharacterized protein BDF20DRAFT_863346 [Mycotypha africana]KAI8981806.1 hypothetical protein BDF20DRAFT_863346 [Mycotypha africana]
MLRSILFIFAIFLTFVVALFENDNGYQHDAQVHRYQPADSKPSHYINKRKKIRFHKDTGRNAGLLNLNPGKHLAIDDITLRHVLNHVIDVDLIKLEKVGENVYILSYNQLVSV